MIALNLDDQILTPAAMAFPQSSGLVKPFSVFILKLRESGILQKLKMKWKLSKGIRLNEPSPGSGTVLGFENVSFPFAVLVLGILAAFILSLLESALKVKKEIV